MKTQLETLFFILAMVLLCQCKKDPEPEPKVTIPDNNFLNALIELGVDTNGDSIISPAEAEAITELSVYGASISNLTGIEAFVNLSVLYCWTNQLTSLDVSNNAVLERLHCNDNQLTTLDVSNCTALEFLACITNQLTTLDVSNNTTLTGLGCSSNRLTTLDVSNNTALTSLSCGGNQLTSLDVSNNTALTELELSDLPSLYQVCVWEMPFPPAEVEVDTTGSPNVYFTMDCSK